MPLRKALAYLFLFPIAITGIFHATLLCAQAAVTNHHAIRGLAWQVQGRWKDVQAGTEISTGDAVLPGSLLEPLSDPGAHSITVLLPDGQRVLSECFTPDDCSRGFRTPAITEAPPAFNVEMLDRMRNALQKRRLPGKSESAHTTPARQDEIVAVLLRDPRSSHAALPLAKVQSLLAFLPSGSYTYTLRSLDGPLPVRQGLLLEKNSSGYMFPVAGPGLYSISVFDSFDTERLNLLVAAVEPGRSEVIANFGHARKVLASWDERYNGWPIHDLLRAYLRSFEEPEAVHQTALVSPR